MKSMWVMGKSSLHWATGIRKLLKFLSLALFAFSLIHILLSLFFNLLPGDFEYKAFPLIAKFKMYPPNADMRWITSLSECGADLKALAERHLWGCDPYGRGSGLGYPPMSVEIARFLHVKGSQTELISSAMGLANVCILCLLNFRVVNSPFLRYLTTSILLLSLPLNLGLERGNIDIVIFNLFAAIAALAALQKRVFEPMISGFCWMAVAIKLYPFPGVIVWNFLEILRNRRFTSLYIAMVLGATLGLTSALPWFLETGNTSAAQPGMGRISHALMGDYAYIRNLAAEISSQQIPFTDSLSRYWGLLIYLGSIPIGIKLRLPRLFDHLINSFQSSFTRVFLHHFIGLTSSTWLTTYALSGSFDYRMILALPGFSFLFGCASRDLAKKRNKFPSFFLVLAISFVLLNIIPLSMGLPHNPKILEFTVNMSDYIFIPILAGMLTAMILPIHSHPALRVSASMDNAPEYAMLK